MNVKIIYNVPIKRNSMDAMQRLSDEHKEMRKSMVERTQELALERLEIEYEKAKVDISESTDLRVLKSMITRIGSLNNPRGRPTKKVTDS